MHLKNINGNRKFTLKFFNDISQGGSLRKCDVFSKINLEL